MTFEEKSERYETVNRLIKATNYISDSELAQLKEITDRCYERYENLKRMKKVMP